MGVILPEVERDGISRQLVRGIGTGRDFVLWECDGRSLKIRSRVTLYCNAPIGKRKINKLSVIDHNNSR